MTDLPRIALALSIGAAGGTVFHLLSLPLPWMLGALFATMVAALSGLPVVGPGRVRNWVVAIIGVMMGARFTPEVLTQAGQWLGALGLVAVYLVVVAVVIVPWQRFVGRQDWTTAWFAGMPGGLAEMIEMGEARGADVRAIVLAHSLRIALTIALIATWFRVINGSSLGSGGGDTAAAGLLPDSFTLEGLGLAMAPGEALLLLAAAIIGSVLGARLRIPAPTFLGPMVVSAALHLSGLSESAPPALLVNMAQVILGTVLGTRFRGMAVSALAPAALLALGATGLTLTIALSFAWVMEHWLGIDAGEALLALAPGGLTEMGLIALAIHADVAFVALCHVFRILVVIISAPVLSRHLFDREASAPPQARPPKA